MCPRAALSMSGVPCGGHGRRTVERVRIYSERAACATRQRALRPRELYYREALRKQRWTSANASPSLRSEGGEPQQSFARSLLLLGSTCSCVLATAVGRLGVSIGSDQRESRFHRASQLQLQSFSLLPLFYPSFCVSLVAFDKVRTLSLFLSLFIIFCSRILRRSCTVSLFSPLLSPRVPFFAPLRLLLPLYPRRFFFFTLSLSLSLSFSLHSFFSERSTRSIPVAVFPRRVRQIPDFLESRSVLRALETFCGYARARPDQPSPEDPSRRLLAAQTEN